MNALICIGQAEIGGESTETVDARDLHAFLKVGRDFSNWIKGRIEQYEFLENHDFVVFAGFDENPSGGRPSKEYALTLDMAKELSMVENNAQGRRARHYFIHHEKLARQMLAGAKPDRIRGGAGFKDAIAAVRECRLAHGREAARRLWNSLSELPPVVESAQDTMAAAPDTQLSDFVRDCCETGEGFRVQARVLYRAYQEWCGDREVKTMTAVGRWLSQNGFTARRVQMGKMVVTRVGLKLR
jgi:phage anti-repressor protein